MSNLDESAWNLAKRVRKEAQELDKLANGALCGVVGGAVGLAVVYGGAWWALASASLFIGGYRLASSYVSYQQNKDLRHLKRYRETIAVLEEVKRSKLTNPTKEELTSTLMLELDQNPERIPALEIDAEKQKSLPSSDN